MERFVYLFYYFFQGILFFQVLFLLLFYASTKTRESLYFGLFLLFTGVNFFISTPELFYNATGAIVFNSWWFKLANIPLVTIGNIFFTLFLRDFFGSLIKNKTLSLIIDVALKIQYFLFIPFIILYLLGKPTEVIFNIVNFIGLSSCIWMTIIIIRKKMRYANLVAIGFICYIIGSFLTSYMLILMVNGRHHLFINQYPLFFVKAGILAIMICYLMAIIQKWYYQEKQIAVQKLESALLAEKMLNQLNTERSRIAADMHDDMGAGLSRMRYLSAAIQQKVQDENIHGELDKLISSSDELVDRMNEIIWTLNSSDGTLEDTLYYIRSQCSEMLDGAGVEFQFSIPEIIPHYIISSEEKRNLYLVVKEAVHNAIKHANAALIKVDCLLSDRVEFIVTDDGIGFDTESVLKKGNGLHNYKKRIQQLKGTYQLISSPGSGTQITFSIPLMTSN